MGIEKAGRVAVKVEGLKISEFFNKDFVQKIREKMGEAKFTHFCIILEKESDNEKDEKEYELVHLTHNSPKEFDEKILTIRTDKPETFEALYDVVKDFVG
ncbi:MAG: hypothetical protein LN417_06695 [Candidatus Thermoplasmatota archaeon]|nr:hypothetical protein [Candidatus Thermoplasmatota archaeon]